MEWAVPFIARPITVRRPVFSNGRPLYGSNGELFLMPTVHPTSNENAHDEHLRTATTEGNSPLENNSIKGWCDNRSKSNAVACYRAELDAPCRPSGGP